jgi:hypothetical protein
MNRDADVRLFIAERRYLRKGRQYPVFSVRLSRRQ